MSPCITIAERLPTVKTHAQTHRAARRTHSPSFWSLVHAEIDGHLTFVRKDWESMWMNLRNAWDLASLQKNRCATYTVSHLADVFARRSLWGVVGPILLGRRKTRHVDIRQIGCCDGLRACLSQCLGSSSLLDRAKKLRWDSELVPIQCAKSGERYSHTAVLLFLHILFATGYRTPQDSTKIP